MRYNADVSNGGTKQRVTFFEGASKMKSKYLSAYITEKEGLGIAPVQGNAEDIAFSAVCMLRAATDAQLTDFDTDTLYFIRSDFPAEYAFPEGLSYVVLKFNNIISPEDFRNGVKLVIVAENEEAYFDFYKRCRKILSIDAEMNHAVMHLVKMASKSRSINDIVKYIAQVYNSTVSIVDNAYGVIAYADPTNEPPEKLKREYTRGFLDSSAIKILNGVDFLTPKVKIPEHKYYIIPNSDDPENSIDYTRNNYCVIYINGNAAAALSVFDNFNIDNYKLKYMEAFSYILSTYLQKQEFYQLNRGAYFNHLMSIIISDLHFDPDVMQNRLALSGYKLEEYKYVITVERTENDENGNSIESLGLYLKNLFPNSIYIALKNKFIYLMSAKKIVPPEKFTDLDKFLKTVGVYAGVSNPFKRFDAVHVFIDEANEALEMGKQTKSDMNIYLFENVCELSVAKNLIMSSGRSPEMYLYPPLMELIDYDRENGTSLVETLREYLQNSKNPKEVYEKLYIHKNTLYYRLDKIKQIMGVNYEHADVQMRINLTFDILDYQKKNNSVNEFIHFD